MPAPCFPEAGGLDYALTVEELMHLHGNANDDRLLIVVLDIFLEITEGRLSLASIFLNISLNF